MKRITMLALSAFFAVSAYLGGALVGSLITDNSSEAAEPDACHGIGCHITGGSVNAPTATIGGGTGGVGGSTAPGSGSGGVN